MDSPPHSETFGRDANFRLEQPIGAMSISPSGRDVVLASKDGLHIIDLDSPYSPPRHLPHRTPWEVADVQWSPFASRDYWIVSTSNQKALVWNVGVSGWRDAIEFVLHAHTRAITDINFSAHHPDILATCAVDSFVHAWDLRAPARPAFSFSDWFAGATQVKWSRQDEHVIASSHDRFLHIWDKRKGAYPARTIEAHGTKIYGIDWNRFEPTKIVTCSLDRTIKFWNTDAVEDIPERVIETPFPVWRARHTPFGWGLLAMPQRGNSDLYLYDRRPVDGVLASGPIPPAKAFSGHKSEVKEFLWRSRGTIKDGVDCRDFQLVTWGVNGELKLHTVHEDTFLAIGYEKGVTRPQRLNFTRRNARYRTFRDDTSEPFSPVESMARNDSVHTHHQMLGARARQSTNIGMSRVSVAQFRGWLQGSKRERRTGMHGKNAYRQDVNPIAWMKNVKIASWNSDSLADEITHIGERFSKVEFESVDIKQRKAVMSLQGPWAENGSTVYTRAELRFPRAYPRDAAAVVTIYKTNSIDEVTHKMLSTEVHTIAETYASRQRGCIEAIVRYLLHDQTMEQIVSYLLGELSDPKMIAGSDMPDDLSSDSDDDNLDGHADPSNSSANLRVPLAKGCGALWSTTGVLVCFFPAKPKEPTSMLSRLGASGLSDSQSNRLFEGFGRLQTISPARRAGNGTQPTVDDAASDLSDVASNFSASSSSTSSSDSEVGIRDGFAPYGNSINLGMRQRSRSAGGSNKSTTLDGTKAGEERRSNVVSIHYDVRDLLPSRRSLGEQYHVFGPGSAVCEHNATVAESAHLTDTASVWRLASLVLQQKVPLEVLRPIDTSSEEITVVARRSLARLRRKDSGIDLSFDRQTVSSAEGCVRWGNHPLGSRYLVTAIFNHFEKKGDIQMLAILSCIFAQWHKHNPPIRSDGIDTATNPLSSYYPSLEVAESLMNSHIAIHRGFTLAITGPSANSRFEDVIALPVTKENQHKRRNTASVAFRPDLNGSGDSNHRDITIMVDTSGGGTSLAKTTAISASTSPEESRFKRRSNSGVAFAASRASLNALAQSFQQSPPSNSSTAGSSLKKFSPSANSGWAGSLFGNTQNSRASRASQAHSEANSDDGVNTTLRGSSSFATLPDLRKDSRRLRDSRGSLKSVLVVGNNNTGKDGVTARSKRRTVKTSLYNQDKFDLENYSELPLLDPDLQWKYRMYRLAYADQLGSWGLFLQQAELLHFDGEHPAETPEWHQGVNKAKHRSPQLEITKCCIKCASTLAPIEKNGVPIGWHCTTISCHLSTEKLSKSQTCSICQQVVRGLSVPCLECGHITCYDCAQAWFAGDSMDLGSTAGTDGEAIETHDSDNEEEGDEPGRSPFTFNPCPTGCGCSCPSLRTISVPSPASQHDGDSKVQTQDRQRLTPGPVSRQDSNSNSNSGSGLGSRALRHKSETPSAATPGPDTAVGAAMIALSLSRSRAASTTTTATTRTSVTAQSDTDAFVVHGQPTGGGGDAATAAATTTTVGLNSDDLVPWSTGKFTSLGRGIGGGLSRGLSNRSSDATIRRL